MSGLNLPARHPGKPLIIGAKMFCPPPILSAEKVLPLPQSDYVEKVAPAPFPSLKKVPVPKKYITVQTTLFRRFLLEK